MSVEFIAGWFLAIFTGLVLGSFASAMSHRIPDGRSWVRARSACPQCGHVLGVGDLVPVFSWLFLRGRCRYCRAAIGVRYPLIELSSALLCLGIFLMHGWSVPAGLMMLAVPFLLAMLVIDLDHMILPDQLNLILAVLGVGYILSSGTDQIGMVLAGGAAGAVLYAGLLYLAGVVVGKMRNRDAVGMGDVKFLAVAGLWLGVWALPFFLILSGVFGVAFGLVWRRIGKSTGQGEAFPFGPALIAAFFACLVLGGGDYFQ